MAFLKQLLIEASKSDLGGVLRRVKHVSVYPKHLALNHAAVVYLIKQARLHRIVEAASGRESHVAITKCAESWFGLLDSKHDQVLGTCFDAGA